MDKFRQWLQQLTFWRSASSSPYGLRVSKDKARQVWIGDSGKALRPAHRIERKPKRRGRIVTFSEIIDGEEHILRRRVFSPFSTMEKRIAEYQEELSILQWWLELCDRRLSRPLRKDERIEFTAYQVHVHEGEEQIALSLQAYSGLRERGCAPSLSRKEQERQWFDPQDIQSSAEYGAYLQGTIDSLMLQEAERLEEQLFLDPHDRRQEIHGSAEALRASLVQSSSPHAFPQDSITV